ncbi:uncharacterized protein PAC_18860 [Phialocephala subalpina]|uniref:Biotrophy-associated secreted protein 2 n=1 Tax=Phialocephala subalpina TaxID=576137 RepID=A0A1L7XVC8_9HELO|nr:uncharacterized protein PAC_18860 [Phialocephala subalpina]
MKAFTVLSLLNSAPPSNSSAANASATPTAKAGAAPTQPVSVPTQEHDPGAPTQKGKTGCGFSSTGATLRRETSAAATSPANGGPAFDPAGAKNVGNGAGQQFIGGQCLSGADCQSTCCAGPSGICSGLGAQTQNGKTGCGFVSTKKLLRA